MNVVYGKVSDKNTFIVRKIMIQTLHFIQRLGKFAHLFSIPWGIATRCEIKISWAIQKIKIMVHVFRQVKIRNFPKSQSPGRNSSLEFLQVPYKGEEFGIFLSSRDYLHEGVALNFSKSQGPYGSAKSKSGKNVYHYEFTCWVLTARVWVRLVLHQQAVIEGGESSNFFF